MVHHLRTPLRLTSERAPKPAAAILDARTLQISCESGPRTGFHRAKRRWRSKVHRVIDTLGHLLALRMTPASEDDRFQAGKSIQAAQQLAGETVELVYVDPDFYPHLEARFRKSLSYRKLRKWCSDKHS